MIEAEQKLNKVKKSSAFNINDAKQAKKIIKSVKGLLKKVKITVLTPY